VDRGTVDVVIVGAGPAGLAVAIGAARRGLSVGVLERRAEGADKACGEGVMPRGVQALEQLGVRARLSPDAYSSFGGIRYIDADGACAEGHLPTPGLAIRRIELVRAMAERAREVGAELHYDCALLSHRRSNGSMLLETERGPLAARMLIGADGLSSRLRRQEGLEVPCVRPPRFGLRRHFRCVPWTRSVEVHLATDAEAYVTPVSNDCVGVAFLWSEDRERPRRTPEERWPLFERKFPLLAAHLAGAPPCSKMRGAGPLERTARARTSDRFALVGDAAGYVDAITGDGISLSLVSAAALTRILPDALVRGADCRSLAPYELEAARLFRRYALATRAVLTIVRRPRLRRRVLVLLRRFPALFDLALATAIG
jgi:2-polyprenyl-6-methoxyphenol hydroxylase-like FAD-dependent oxidoreductase